MPKFSEQFIQQVAQATDIVDLVSQHVAINKRGREFVGLCPFHQDRRPSMYVSPAKQIFKCFACGAGGGVFQFLMLHDKLTFPEAVTALAERAHIPLPRDPSVPTGPEDLSKTELLKVAAFAAEHFHGLLLSPAGKDTLEYAHKRGLTDESVGRFKLGYAAESWDSLLRAAKRKGFTENQLVAAGLAIRREAENAWEGQDRGCYDRFRNRLIFPIYDTQNRVIAFGGRALDPNDKAKYLNSPEGTLFDKSGNLFALNWSRDGIGKSGRAVVVEGYMDAVIPLQAGVNNVVATLGTALTDRHVQMLSRYAQEVVLVFDADAAGQNAAERGLEMFLAQAVHVRVATIPDGKDPCDYVLAHGGEAFKQLVDAAPDALQYAWLKREAAVRAAGDNLAARQRVIEDFLRLVVSSAAFGAIDELRRGQLAQHIAHLLNVPASEMQTQMRRMARQITQRSGAALAAQQAAATPAPSRSAAEPAERQILEVLLNRPDLFESAAEEVAPPDFADPRLAAVAQEVWRRGLNGHLVLEELMASENMAPLGSLVAELVSEGERRGNFEPTLAGAIAHIRYRRDRQMAQDMKSAGHDDQTLRQLGEDLRKPDVRRFPKIS